MRSQGLSTIASVTDPDLQPLGCFVLDGLGMLARFSLISGQASEAGEVLPLLGELKPLSLAADKAYDVNAILQHLKSLGIQAVIPSQ